jgi:hypothetical protein
LSSGEAGSATAEEEDGEEWAEEVWRTKKEERAHFMRKCVDLVSRMSIKRNVIADRRAEDRADDPQRTVNGRK